MKTASIKGHDRVLELLVNSFKNGRFAHAYLFFGPDGIGKSLVALRLAQILNCECDDFSACGECPSCVKIEKKNHPDVHWISRAEDSDVIKIGDIRALAGNMYLRPFEARTKVYIISDAERMTEEANNALLKTLEEPPKESVVILITSRPRGIFATIVSRCQRIRFSALADDMLAEILSRDFGLAKAESHFLARLSGGRMGKALELRQPRLLKQRDALINTFVYMADSGRLDEMPSYGSKEELEEALEILSFWFRDILFAKMRCDGSQFVNADRQKDIINLQSRYSVEEIFDIIGSLVNIRRLLGVNINAKIALAEVRVKTCKK